MRESGSPKRFAATTSPRREQLVLGGADRGELAGEVRMQARDLRQRGARLDALERLQQRLRERAADSERLADRAHLRPELRRVAGELLEVEPRRLHRDVVERRLEGGARDAGDVVRQLVERVADGEERRQLRDREARRLRRERGGARDARVHLDQLQLAGLRLVCELDVGAAGGDADGAGAGEGGVAEPLQLAVGERLLRRHRPRVAGVDADRVEVLDRADDDAVAAQCRRRPRARTPASLPASARRAPGRSGSLRGRARRARAAPVASARSRRRAPPSVNAGRTTAGTGQSSSWSSDVTTTLVGTGSPAAVIAARKSERSSAVRIACRSAPISSTPCSARTPFSASSTARLSAVWPPRVGSSASGCSRPMISASVGASSGSR